MFPTLLEKEGLLSEILSVSFAENSRTLYDDLVEYGLEKEFMTYIYSKADVKASKNNSIEVSENNIDVEKNPYELLDEVGYTLYECKSETDIQSFKKYYAEDEELCTFNGGRLHSCVVFFAVRKDVENIKRENFKNPKREDEYGTSVMGIQFTKYGMCTVSIKNRYNWTVDNPDATYGNDLDRITPGLSKSFSNLLKDRDLGFNEANVEAFELPGYTVVNGKYYKYNMEINGIYYCPGNIVIDGENVHKLENPEKQLLIDNFVLDMENKTITMYDKSYEDGFIKSLQDIEKLEIRRDKEKGNGIRKIIIKQKDKTLPVTIEIDKDNQITGYENDNLRQVENEFLKYNQSLKYFKLDNVEQVGHEFLSNNKEMATFEFPNLVQVGDCFMMSNRNITDINLPKLERVGHNFLNVDDNLKTFEAPNLIKVGNQFLESCLDITDINLPKIESMGDNFLQGNYNLKTFEAPNLMKVGNNFLGNNRELRDIKLPKIERVGDDFLVQNENLKIFEAPNLIEVGNNFLMSNKNITNLNLQKLEKIGNDFLESNNSLKNFGASNLAEIGRRFLKCNRVLEKINVKDLSLIPNDYDTNDKGVAFFIKKNTFGEHGKEFFGNFFETFKKIIISPKNISQLDKANQLTSSEIGMAKRMIERQRDVNERDY